METKRRRIFAIASIAAAVVLALVLVLILWKPAPKGVVVAVAELPDSLNPVFQQNTMGLDANELLFDGLVNFETDSSGVITTELGLAASIEQDKDTKKTYHVVLKEVRGFRV